MAYVREKKRMGKSGTLTYYYLVEGERINGKVKQKFIEYLGTKPHVQTIKLDQAQIKAVVNEVFLANLTPDDLKNKLKQLKIPITEGVIKEMNITHKIGGEKWILRLYGQPPSKI